MTTPMEPSTSGLRGGGSATTGGATTSFVQLPRNDIPTSALAKNSTTSHVSPIQAFPRSFLPSDVPKPSIATSQKRDLSGTRGVSSSIGPSSMSTSSFSPSSSAQPLTTLYAATATVTLPEGEDNSAATIPKIRPDQPYLYDVPDELSLSYRPIPALIRFSIFAASFLLTSLIQASQQHLLHASLRFWQVFRRLLLENNRINLVKFAFQTLATTFISTLIVQDIWFSPSRVSIPTMIQNKYLPSSLSRFKTILTSATATAGVPTYPKDEVPIGPLAVHYLVFDQSSSLDLPEFDLAYFNHGFGASSLSWLPAIPSLTKRIKARRGIAHDAPGFGFTERVKTRNAFAAYSAAGSAAIGNYLLSNSSPESPKAVALFGHSMGSAATLRMALDLPPNVSKFVCLTAPALVKGSFLVQINESKASQEVSKSVNDLVQAQPSPVRTPISTAIGIVRKVVLDKPFQWILKRLCSKESFWKNGLSSAWGDSQLLSDSDILRFRWPSIAANWEDGILSFVRSRIRATLAYPKGEVELLRKVLDDPNTFVVIFSGTKDAVVPHKDMVELGRIFAPKLRVVPLEGQGHDPFEEETEIFVEKVEEELGRWNANVDPK